MVHASQNRSPLTTEELIDLIDGLRSGRMAFSLSPEIAEQVDAERASQVREHMKAYQRALLAFYEEELAKLLN